MKLNKLEKLILKELYYSSKNSLYSYNIYKKSFSSISSFNIAVEQLLSENMIQIEENKLVLKLTPDGFLYMQQYYSRDTINKIQLWDLIPQDFKQTSQLEINTFYVPNATLVQ